MSRAFALCLMLLAAQPAAATVVVQMAPAAPAAPASCAPADDGCADSAPTGASLPAGPLVAGMVGVLVLGLVFGRRKSGLPEVVS